MGPSERVWHGTLPRKSPDGGGVPSMPIGIHPPLIGFVPLHALLVAVVMFAVTVPIVLRLARREGQRWLVPLLLGGLGLHFLGSALQVVVVRALYANVADFHLYDGQGAVL